MVDGKLKYELSFGDAERREAYEKLNRTKKDDVEIVALGCPHCTLEYLRKIAERLDGKKINNHTKLYLTTNSMIKAMADIQGYTKAIERAGGVIMQDSCCLELALDPDTVFVTNSAKMAHYAPGATGLKNTLVRNSGGMYRRGIDRQMARRSVMAEIVLKGRTVHGGKAEGEALVAKASIGWIRHIQP